MKNTIIAIALVLFSQTVFAEYTFDETDCEYIKFRAETIRKDRITGLREADAHRLTAIHYSVLEKESAGGGSVVIHNLPTIQSLIIGYYNVPHMTKSQMAKITQDICDDRMGLRME